MANLLNETTEIGSTRVSVNPGASIMKSVACTEHWINTYAPDLIIVMSGICNITSKDSKTKNISLRHNKLSDVVDAVMTPIRQAHDLIRNMGDYTVSFSTVTGVDLTDVNNRERKHMNGKEYWYYTTNDKVMHPQQDTLNRAIVIINREITAYNEANGIPTTWMAEVVHPYLRGRHRHYYGRLADGCHPDDNTRKRWAHQIARTIRRISANEDGATKVTPPATKAK